MDSLRVVLVIIGVVIILALLGHGLWTIRKNNQVAKDKREQLERKRRRMPDDLFSQADEVDTSELSDSDWHDPLQPRAGRAKQAVRVEQAQSADSISRAAVSQRSDQRLAQSSEQQTDERRIGERVEPDLFSDLVDDNTIEQMEIDLNDDEFALRQQAGNKLDSAGFTADELTEPMDDEARVLSADESHIRAADEVRADPNDRTRTDVDAIESESFSATSTEYEALEATSKREAELADTVANTAADTQSTNPPEAANEEPFEVITLFVTGDIQGAILLQMTAELGLKYGEMDIFHRHAESSGHGPVLFSVANMFNPGTFDITQLERFETQGIVLFMTLPLKSDGHQAFTMMYNAANKIADAMPRAAVLDGNRNPVTKQSVQHTYQRIREFERKQRLHKPSTPWQDER